MLPVIEPDGMIRYSEPPANVPAGWTPSPDNPQIYLPPWQPCAHRLVGFDNRTMVITPTCLLALGPVPISRCIGCPLRQDPSPDHYRNLDFRNLTQKTYPVPALGPLERIQMQIPEGCKDAKTATITTIADKPLAEAAPVTPPTPEAYSPNVPRPDLAAISTTLPPDDASKDRTFRRPVFEPDGSIVYPHDDKDWEPPQNINGYVRDPDNQWRFLPLWLPCALRMQTAFLKANCGCIDIIMRCNNPQAPTFGQRVPSTICATCPVRSEP